MSNPPFTRKAEILAALPGTVSGIARKTGIQRSTVGYWLARLSDLQNPDRCVYIKGWERRAGAYAAVYASGTLPNRPCRLKPLTQAERTANWRRNAIAAGIWPRILAGRRARDAAKKVSYLNDPLLAAFFSYKPAKLTKEPAPCSP